jgi:hypothetical protein
MQQGSPIQQKKGLKTNRGPRGTRQQPQQEEEQEEQAASNSSKQQQAAASSKQQQQAAASSSKQKQAADGRRTRAWQAGRCRSPTVRAMNRSAGSSTDLVRLCSLDLATGERASVEASGGD